MPHFRAFKLTPKNFLFRHQNSKISKSGRETKEKEKKNSKFCLIQMVSSRHFHIFKLLNLCNSFFGRWSTQNTLARGTVLPFLPKFTFLPHISFFLVVLRKQKQNNFYPSSKQKKLLNIATPMAQLIFGFYNFSS